MFRLALVITLLSTATKDLASVPRKEMPKTVEQMLQSSPKTKAFITICDDKTCAIINIAEEK